MKNILITLVNPSHPGNMGAVARAMKNMSLQALRLVKPQRFLNEEAFARAAGADDILLHAEYFDELLPAVEDCQLIIGTSARIQVPDVSALSIREAASILVHAARSEKVTVLLGREHAGLTNEELALCHYHVYIPANADFSSLNLGAAAQIICYEIFLASNEQKEESLPICAVAERATQGEIEHLFSHLAITLENLDFYNPNNPRRLMQKLRALFGRTHLSKSEVAILRGILSAVDKSANKL